VRLFLRSHAGRQEQTDEREGVHPAASIYWLCPASHAIYNGAPITLVSATPGGSLI